MATTSKPRPRAKPAPATPPPEPPQVNAASSALVYIALSALILVLALGGAGFIYQRVFTHRIYLGVRAMGHELGGYTAPEARRLLGAQFERYLSTPLVLTDGRGEWRVTPRELGLDFDLETTIAQALLVGRTGPLLGRLGTVATGLRGDVPVAAPGMRLDRELLIGFVRQVGREVDRPATSASLALKPDQKVAIVPARAGQRLNVERTVDQIELAFSSLADAPIQLIVEEVRPPVADADLQAKQTMLEQMLARPIELRFEGKTWALGGADLAGMVELRTEAIEDARHFELALDEALLRAFLEPIAAGINRPAQNARFGLRDGKVVAVKPGVDGREVDVAATLAMIKQALATEQRAIDLPVKILTPALTDAQAASISFPDKLATASTHYGGTLPARIVNVELAANRLNGTIVLPGETFSFNGAVGEVSYRSGYKQAYGISRDENNNLVTIPSEGGGICQVATTVFQAAFWAGMPIVERHWHSYWIPRYGSPPAGLKGLDATIDQVYDAEGKLIYALDFQWTNATDHPLLVVTATDGYDIEVAIWGTSQGWDVTASEPKIDAIVDADETPVYQADPTLAEGSELMVEHAEAGFQATIIRTVSKGGKPVHEQTFVATYRPSRNVYLVGGPAPEIETPVVEDRPADLETVEPDSTTEAEPTIAAQPTNDEAEPTAEEDESSAPESTPDE